MGPFPQNIRLPLTSTNPHSRFIATATLSLCPEREAPPLTMACRRATQLAMRRAMAQGRSEATSMTARGLATRAETSRSSVTSGDWGSSFGRRTEAGAAGSVYARGSFRRGFAADTEASEDAKKAEDAHEPSPRMVRLADDICGLTLLEVHDLTTILKKRLGLDAMPMMGMPMGGAAMGGAPAAGGAAAAPEEAAAEKTEFDVKLASFDSASKIKVIKEVRAITELGLKEAKDLVEGAPAVLKKGLKKEEAEAIKEKLAKVGGVVTLE